MCSSVQTCDDAVLSTATYHIRFRIIATAFFRFSHLHLNFPSVKWSCDTVVIVRWLPSAACVICDRDCAITEGDRELIAHQQRVAAVAQARRRHHVVTSNDDDHNNDNSRRDASEVDSDVSVAARRQTPPRPKPVVQSTSLCYYVTLCHLSLSSSSSSSAAAANL